MAAQRPPKEPPPEGSAAEARLWVRAYRQLLEIETATLETMEAALDSPRHGTVYQAERADALAMAADVDHSTRQLALWEARLTNLQRLGSDRKDS